MDYKSNFPENDHSVDHTLKETKTSHVPECSNEEKFNIDNQLQHAAGDFEPLYQKKTATSKNVPKKIHPKGSNNDAEEIRFANSSLPASDAIDDPTNEDLHLAIEQEELKRANKIEDVRASYGAYDPDRN